MIPKLNLNLIIIHMHTPGSEVLCLIDVRVKLCLIYRNDGHHPIKCGKIVVINFNPKDNSFQDTRILYMVLVTFFKVFRIIHIL
jgi:hypothetical protein